MKKTLNILFSFALIFLITGQSKAKENYLEDLIKDKEIKVIIYDGMSYDEATMHFESKMNGYIDGYGSYFFNKAYNLGVDPYMSLAIMMHETGCKWTCSYIARNCNNFGGMKGAGCGSYQKFKTKEEGIDSFLNNLKYNYIDKGLTTPVAINTIYAENKAWHVTINRYMEELKK